MLNDLTELIDSLVRDESSRLTASDLAEAIRLALARYGSDWPRNKVEDVTSAGGDRLPLPTAWESNSELVSVEYPIGEMPPAMLDCSIYTAPAGKELRLGKGLPLGAEARLTFTVAHVVSDSQETILPGHREAVACYAAALLLEQLAAAAINDGESTISADTTDRRTKAQEYGSRAKALKTRYGEAMGIGTGGGSGAASPAAGGQTVAWPSRRRLLKR